MTHSDTPERPLPPGIIIEDYVEDEEIGLLASGKEADVYLVERRGPAGECLLAAKRYRPPEMRAFKRDGAYRAHRRIDGLVRDVDGWRRPKQGRGVQKAMDRRSAFGRRTLAEQWMRTEFEVLTTLWHAGAPVPYPVAMLDDGVLMEYVGDAEQAAPRLARARVDGPALPSLFEQVRHALKTFARAGVVHADLSPYNTLLWKGSLWVIDLPQSVPVLLNDDAVDFLHRDVVNICAWFIRKGLRIDPEDLFVELLNDVFELQTRDLFRAQ